jgi:alkylated DNA repair protein alkB homolog 6
MKQKLYINDELIELVVSLAKCLSQALVYHERVTDVIFLHIKTPANTNPDIQTQSDPLLKMPNHCDQTTTVSLLQDSLTLATLGITYTPRFITETAQAHILQRVYDQKWTQLRSRRAQMYGVKPIGKSKAVNAALPDWLDVFLKGVGIERINHVLINGYGPDEGIMAHEDGDSYESRVRTFSLGEACRLDFYPLGKHGTENNHDSAPLIEETSSTEPKGSDDQSKDQSSRDIAFSLILEPGSLVELTCRSYTDYMHAIAPSTSFSTSGALNLDMTEIGDCTYTRTKERVSLTCRTWKKVVSVF